MDQGKGGSRSGPTLRCPQLWDTDVTTELEINLLNTNICSIPACLSLSLWVPRLADTARTLSALWRVCPNPRHCTAPVGLPPAAASYFFIQGANAALGKCPDTNKKIQIIEESSFSFLEIIS